MLWDINDEPASTVPYMEKSLKVYNAVLVNRDHRGKVRDIKYNPVTKELMTLSTEGCIRLWDVNTPRTRCGALWTLPLSHTTESVCLSVNERQNLFAVGSQSHLSIIDPRLKRIVCAVGNEDDGWGIRAVCINDNLVTCGGGCGHLSFFDLRTQSFRSFPPKDSEGKAKNYLEIGSGWLVSLEMICIIKC